MPKLFVELLTKAAATTGFVPGSSLNFLTMSIDVARTQPVIIGGDFNFDLSEEPATSLLAGASRVGAPFENPFDNGNLRATTTRSRLGRARAIDWILIRGPLGSAEA